MGNENRACLLAITGGRYMDKKEIARVGRVQMRRRARVKWDGRRVYVMCKSLRRSPKSTSSFFISWRVTYCAPKSLVNEVITGTALFGLNTGASEGLSRVYNLNIGGPISPPPPPSSSSSLLTSSLQTPVMLPRRLLTPSSPRSLARTVW